MLGTKTRPLWRLSDFVVEELPGLLVDNHLAIPSQVENMLRYIIDSGNVITAYMEGRELALLDLKFCEVAMIRTEQQVPLILTNAVDFFCGNMNIPGLQYHELVRVNPQDDIRTFATGEFKQTEAMFYNAHRFVEQRLNRLVDAVEDFLESSIESTQLVSGYRDMLDFGPIRSIMTNLHNMPSGHFASFRPYISDPCPVREYDGPSGAFSWRIPYLELLFWGKNLPQSYLEEMNSKLLYYSPRGRSRIQRTLSELTSRSTLLDYSRDNENVTNVIRTWIAFMKTFRGMHLGAVKQQIPEVFNDQSPGTSGNVRAGSYLRNRLNAMNLLYDEFSQNHPM